MTAQMVPNKTEMSRYLRRKLTQQQIVDAWEEDTGIRVSRSAIAMAIERYGLKSSRPRPRYEDTLPWTVRDEHAHANEARMLRLEGRRRNGRHLSDKELRILRAWLKMLDERDAVVMYDPETDQGFWWVRREEQDGADIIRRPGVEVGT